MVKVDIVDLTCRSFPYDRHLIGGLEQIGVHVDLWTAGCLPEQHSGMTRRSLVDIAGTVSREGFRKVAKGIEYLINATTLQWNLRVESSNIVHYQWLPFAEKVPFLERLNLVQAKRSSAGVVHTVHNVLPHDTGNRYRNAFQKLYQIPDALICHTESAKSQLVEDFSVPPERIWVIPHGPLSSEVTYVPKEEAKSLLSFQKERPLCVLFGFMRPYKGVEFLIDSWQHVKEQEPSARLMLAGQPEDGYGKLLTDKINELELEKEIDTHFEFLPQEKLNLSIQAADVLVYPYSSITQSGALLTGLTSGTPIVASDVGGFSEVIQHNQTGVLVEYGDEKALAEELVQLMRDGEKRRQLGHAAQELVKGEYSWGSIARKTLDCYQSVINES